MRKFNYLTVFLMFLQSLYGFSQRVMNSELPQSALSELAVEIRHAGLPLIIIDTENAEDPSCVPIAPPEGCMGNGITQNDYVKGRLYLVAADELLYDSGDYAKGESGMRAKVRGNSSAYIDCKSLKIKLEKKFDFMFRDNKKYADKEWVLLNIYSTYNLKTVLGFHLGRKVCEQWEPAWQFVNLLQNGVYKGVYMLAEPVSCGEKRCDLDESGFLIEADPYWWNEDGATFHTEHLPYSMAYTFKYPDSEDLTDETLNQISSYVAHFEESLYNGDNYADWIDVPSFANWMLVHDILGSLDGCGSNIFLKKYDYNPADPTSSKLQMGPLWDFDSAFENKGKWASVHSIPEFYFGTLFKDKAFVDIYAERWNAVRGNLYADAMQEIYDFQGTYGDAVNRSRELMKRYTAYKVQPLEKMCFKCKIGCTRVFLG